VLNNDRRTDGQKVDGQTANNNDNEHYVNSTKIYCLEMWENRHLKCNPASNKP